MNLDLRFNIARRLTQSAIRNQIALSRFAVLFAVLTVAVLLMPTAGCDVKPISSSTSSGKSKPSEPVKLSAGVALPQTLPSGTAMGFSVDYVLLEDLPDSNAAVGWVIESAKASVEISVRLDSRGNLTTFAPDMKPEHRPFRSYLVINFPDGRKLRISPEIAMRSP